jgi:hypothetical protein
MDGMQQALNHVEMPAQLQTPRGQGLQGPTLGDEASDQAHVGQQTVAALNKKLAGRDQTANIGGKEVHLHFQKVELVETTGSYNQAQNHGWFNVKVQLSLTVDGVQKTSVFSVDVKGNGRSNSYEASPYSDEGGYRLGGDVMRSFHAAVPSVSVDLDAAQGQGLQAPRLGAGLQTAQGDALGQAAVNQLNAAYGNKQVPGDSTAVVREFTFNSATPKGNDFEVHVDVTLRDGRVGHLTFNL